MIVWCIFARMQNKWSFELISWLIIAIVILTVLLPIYNGIHTKYPFYVMNAAGIAVFLYFTKCIFLLRHTFFSHMAKFKFILILVCILLILYFIDGLYEGQRYFDEERLYEALRYLPSEDQIGLGKYIRYELIFFTTSALIVSVLFPIRLIVSEWRIRNRGTV